MPIRAVTVDSSIARVRAFIRSQGWSVYKAAAEAHLSGNALVGMFAEGWNPRAETLRAVERIIPAEFAPSEAAA